MDCNIFFREATKEEYESVNKYISSISHDCSECLYKEKADKFFYCMECSTCINKEKENTNIN